MAGREPASGGGGDGEIGGIGSQPRTRLRAPAIKPTQPLCDSSASLPQTGRVMVKDENLCVHCGLCAERCPTAAWDMQKSTIIWPHADRWKPHVSRASSTSRVNDFVIKIATVNGTGSASANGLLMKAIFRSGVPVVGKNYFPSNIQGMPTWYEIRVTRDDHRCRAGAVDIMVALNAETYAHAICRRSLRAAIFIYDSTWPRAALLKRDDITVIGVPLARLCNENFQGVRTRILMKNICYAGVLAALCDLDLDVIRALLAETYAKKPQLVDSNMKAIQLGYDYARRTSVPAAAAPREDGRDQRPDRHRRQHRRGARAACTPAPRSAPGIRSRRRPR